MKKFLVLGLAGLFLFAGCGNNKNKNTVVCTGSTKENGVKISMKVTATLKDEKVSAAKAIMTFGDKKTAKQFCSLFELANSFAESDDKKVDIKCNGKNVEFADYDKFMSTDDADAKIIGLTKDEFISSMKEQELSCK